MDFNRALLSSSSLEGATNQSALSFLSMDVNTFGGGTLLLGNEQEDSLDSLDTPDDVPCSMPETTAVDDTNVLVLMSTCLSTTTRSLVTSWISKLSDQNLLYFDGSSAYTIKFVVKYVVGAKGTPSANCPANSDDTYTKVSDRPANTIAGIFFVNDAQAQKVVENKFPNDIKEQFFLQFCETPTCTALTHKVSGNDVPYVMVSSASDLAAISPFSVARALHCENLTSGIPFSYVDTAGNRQCFCSCAATAKRVISGTGVNRSYQCVKNDPRGVCTWKPAAGSAAGFKKEVTVVGTDGACSTAADDVLSVLYPVDNYVDYLRTNDQDTTSGKNVGAGPRISFDITKGSSVVTKPFAWKEFQTSPSAAMKSLPFAGYGVFDIKATATDYFSTTGVSCAGCIAVVDKARPIPASGCPSTIPGTTLTEFKDTSVGPYDNVLTGVQTFQNSVTPDGCGSTRCDDLSITGTKFSGAAATPNDYAFFSPTAVSGDLNDVLKGTTAYTQCSRCLSGASVTLKEEWYDYVCGATTAPQKQCSGTATCSLLQTCLKVDSTKLANVKVKLTDSTLAASDAVINAITNKVPLVSEPDTMHVGLDCTDFLTAKPDASSTSMCVKTVALSSWLTKSAAPFASTTWFTEADVDTFVSWEYKIGDATVQFDDVYTFYLPSTKVTATAKSKCGTIASFTFHVNLHVNNVIQVCDHFKAMWYQTSRSAVRSFGDFFLYPGSDFAEITFDYHPNIGLGYDINEFQHTISTVSCTATYASRTSKTIVDVGASDSKEIVKQFAMQAVYLDLTKAETSIDVLCTFKYSSTNIAATDILTQKCPATLTIKEEEAPWILTSAAKCNRDGACGALPAPYQACGGYRVYATATTTEVTDQETACCAACTGTGTSNVAPTCSPILGLPGSAKFKDIKRCQPTAAQESLTAESFASSELVAETSATTDTSGVTAVLAASALVALVALVVVQQRRRGHDSMAATRNGCAIEEDAYYPLLN